MKTLLKLLLLAGVLAYLIVAFVSLSGGRDTTRCTTVSIVIADSAHAGFITRDEVQRLLSVRHLYPLGMEMDSIKGDTIEKTLLANPFIDRAMCYKSPGGRLTIHVSQRLPLMRIKGDGGSDCYIDAHGNAMRAQGYVADLPVATGAIDTLCVRHQLAPLARHLYRDEFANNLIDQIVVTPDRHIDLVPRIGCDVIHLGRLDSMQIRTLFRNLEALYTKVLPTVGWNTYREVSLEYNGQVVCRKI